ALLSAAGKQRPYKAVNIKPPAMPGDIYLHKMVRKLTFCEIHPYDLDKSGNFIGICAHLMVYYPLSKE
ncbi:hypothetical protein, partial [Mitsuokella jalaludinii]|uniref:hypothetical protein n=1 Tax=Mitsuokella jalaludinii TaxID=187979 RepID=UPI001C11CEFE